MYNWSRCFEVILNPPKLRHLCRKTQRVIISGSSALVTTDPSSAWDPGLCDNDRAVRRGAVVKLVWEPQMELLLELMVD